MLEELKFNSIITSTVVEQTTILKSSLKRSIACARAGPTFFILELNSPLHQELESFLR